MASFLCYSIFMHICINASCLTAKVVDITGQFFWKLLHRPCKIRNCFQRSFLAVCIVMFVQDGEREFENDPLNDDEVWCVIIMDYPVF